VPDDSAASPECLSVDELGGQHVDQLFVFGGPGLAGPTDSIIALDRMGKSVTAAGYTKGARWSASIARARPTKTRAGVCFTTTALGLGEQSALDGGRE